jgi:hypothetical protein
VAVQFGFDPATHAYTVDGVRVPSVTQVLEAVGISDFSSVPADRLAYAQNLGTAVHQATEAFDQDDLDFASVAGTVVEPYLEAWSKFRRDTGFTPRLIETRGVATVRGQLYGYCIDREGPLGPKAEPTVLDIKTGEPSRSWRIQLAAYEHSLFQRDGRHRRRVVVRLHADGRWSSVTFSQPSDLDVWNWALALETWKQNNQ